MTSSSQHVAPTLIAGAFNCPRCGAYAQQLWTRLNAASGATTYAEFHQSKCLVCGQGCLWMGHEILDPGGPTAPPAHELMPDDVREFYQEANDVAGRSPRAAAALLRLAVQRLLGDLVPGEANLNTAIGVLVRKGLDPQAALARDILRVVGNNAVHPGELQIDGESGLVPGLFNMLNLIVEQVLARPAQLQSLYAVLPPGATEAITKRDAVKVETDP